MGPSREPANSRGADDRSPHVPHIVEGFDKVAAPVYVRQRLAAMLAWLATRCLPPSWWYRITLFFMDLQVRSRRPSMRAGRLNHIEPWMERLTYLGGAFDIPCKVSGLAALPPIGLVENGVLYCSGHLPMIRVGLRVLIQQGRTPTAAIAESTAFAIHSEVVAVWGMRDQIPGINADMYALVKARSILRSGGSVALLTDKVSRGRHSSNAFQLARRLGTRIVFFFTEVEPDGTVLVTFKQPPYPICTSDESVEKNIAALESELKQILDRAGAEAELL